MQIQKQAVGLRYIPVHRQLDLGTYKYKTFNFPSGENPILASINCILQLLPRKNTKKKS
jgi:hypothetical protein